MSRGHCLQTIECVTNKHFIPKRLARAVVSTFMEKVILNDVFNLYQFRRCAGGSVFSKSNVIVYPILFVYHTLTFHWDALLESLALHFPRVGRLFIFISSICVPGKKLQSLWRVVLPSLLAIEHQYINQNEL